MTPQPSQLYTACGELFEQLQVVTGGDRGATDIMGGRGYAREIMIRLTHIPRQGQSVMQQACFPGLHNPECPPYYALSKVPGFEGHVHVPYSGEPTFYGGATPDFIEAFFQFWRQFAVDLEHFLQERHL